MAALEPAQVRLRHSLVRLDAEEQRDVDVDPFVRRLLNRRHAFGRARNLDHHVTAVELPPVVPRGLDRPLPVVRDIRRDLQRHKPISLVRLVIHVR